MNGAPTLAELGQNSGYVEVHAQTAVDSGVLGQGNTTVKTGCIAADATTSAKLANPSVTRTAHPPHTLCDHQSQQQQQPPRETPLHNRVHPTLLPLPTGICLAGRAKQRVRERHTSAALAVFSSFSSVSGSDSTHHCGTAQATRESTLFVALQDGTEQQHASHLSDDSGTLCNAHHNSSNTVVYTAFSPSSSPTPAEGQRCCGADLSVGNHDHAEQCGGLQRTPTQRVLRSARWQERAIRSISSCRHSNTPLERIMSEQGQRRSSSSNSSSSTASMCCANPACTAPYAPHKCSGCLSVRYCSRECQVEDYPSHQQACAEISRKHHRIAAPRFLAFNHHDQAAVPVIRRLQKMNHSQISSRSLFYALGVEHSEDVGDAEVEGDDLRHLLKKSLHPGVIYSIPTDCGVAQVCVASAVTSQPHVPDTCPITSSLPSEVDLLTFMERRHFSKRRHGSDSSTDMPQDSTGDHGLMSKSERASTVLEAVFLFDKTVFPTLQLFRALNQGMALSVVADEDELSWAVLCEEQLKGYDPEILQRVRSIDRSHEFVFLVHGTCIHPSGEDTVMLVMPLQVARAFHSQKLEPRVEEEVGVVQRIFPPAPLVITLVRAAARNGDDSAMSTTCERWERAYKYYLERLKWEQQGAVQHIPLGTQQSGNNPKQEEQRVGKLSHAFGNISLVQEGTLGIDDSEA